MISRRGFLAGIIAAGVAPAIIKNPMKLWVPKQEIEVVHFLPISFPDWVRDGYGEYIVRLMPNGESPLFKLTRKQP